jgi:hypothetical protein
MRQPKYLSNTSISLFYKDRMEFYLKYLADNRPPRFKQTQPMSVGSAFDGFVKSYIVEKLLGKNNVPKEFERETIFLNQVEEHNQDWARIAGQHTFECYKKSGALAALMLELELADAQPRFEFTVERTIRGVPLLGKPDVWFITKDGMHVLIDWKVNGYCATRSVSPKKGYIKIMDGWDHKEMKPSRNHNCMHKDAQILRIGGMLCNVAVHLEDVDIGWANQTALYGWLMGEEIGAKFMTGIDQIVCKPGKDKPQIRVARHRCRVSPAYQQGLWLRIKKVWDTIQSGHIFDDLPREKSLARQLMLDDYHKAYEGNDPNEKWFQEVTRERPSFF